MENRESAKTDMELKKEQVAENKKSTEIVWYVEYTKEMRKCMSRPSMKRFDNSIKGFIKLLREEVVSNVNGRLRVRSFFMTKEFVNCLYFYLELYNELGEILDHTLYTVRMMELMPLYLDLEILSYQTNVYKTADAATRILTVFNCFLKESEPQACEVLLHVIVHWELNNLESARELLSVLFQKLLGARQQKPKNDVEYVQYVLMYRLWKILEKNNTDKYNDIMEQCATRLETPRPLELHKNILRIFPKSTPFSQIKKMMTISLNDISIIKNFLKFKNALRRHSLIGLNITSDDFSLMPFDNSFDMATVRFQDYVNNVADDLDQSGGGQYSMAELMNTFVSNSENELCINKILYGENSRQNRPNNIPTNRRQNTKSSVTARRHSQANEVICIDSDDEEENNTRATLEEKILALFGKEKGLLQDIITSVVASKATELLSRGNLRKPVDNRPMEPICIDLQSDDDDDPVVFQPVTSKDAKEVSATEVSKEVSTKEVSAKEVSKQVSVKEVSSKEVSVKEISVKEVSAKQVSPKEVSANDVLVNEVSVNEISANEVSVKEVSVKEISDKIMLSKDEMEVTTKNLSDMEVACKSSTDVEMSEIFSSKEIEKDLEITAGCSTSMEVVTENLINNVPDTSSAKIVEHKVTSEVSMKKVAIESSLVKEVEKEAIAGNKSEENVIKKDLPSNKIIESSKEPRIEVSMECDEPQSICQNVSSGIIENSELDSDIINKEIQIPQVDKQVILQTVVDNSLMQETSDLNSGKTLIEDLAANAEELTIDTQLDSVKCDKIETPKPEAAKNLITTPELIDTCMSILAKDETSRTTALASTTQTSRGPQQSLLVSLNYDTSVNSNNLENLRVNKVITSENVTSVPQPYTILEPINDTSKQIVTDTSFDSQITSDVNNSLNTEKVDDSNLPRILDCYSLNTTESSINEHDSSIDLQEDVALNVSQSPKTYIDKGKDPSKRNWRENQRHLMSEKRNKILSPLRSPLADNSQTRGISFQEPESTINEDRRRRNSSFMTPAQLKYMQDDESDSDDMEIDETINSTRDSLVDSDHSSNLVIHEEESTRPRDLVGTIKVIKAASDYSKTGLRYYREEMSRNAEYTISPSSPLPETSYSESRQQTSTQSKRRFSKLKNSTESDTITSPNFEKFALADKREISRHFAETRGPKPSRKTTRTELQNPVQAPSASSSQVFEVKNKQVPIANVMPQYKNVGFIGDYGSAVRLHKEEKDSDIQFRLNFYKPECNAKPASVPRNPSRFTPARRDVNLNRNAINQHILQSTSTSNTPTSPVQYRVPQTGLHWQDKSNGILDTVRNYSNLYRSIDRQPSFSFRDVAMRTVLAENNSAGNRKSDVLGKFTFGSDTESAMRERDRLALQETRSRLEKFVNKGTGNKPPIRNSKSTSPRKSPVQKNSSRSSTRNANRYRNNNNYQNSEGKQKYLYIAPASHCRVSFYVENPAINYSELYNIDSNRNPVVQLVDVMKHLPKGIKLPWLKKYKKKKNTAKVPAKLPPDKTVNKKPPPKRGTRKKNVEPLPLPAPSTSVNHDTVEDWNTPQAVKDVRKVTKVLNFTDDNETPRLVPPVPSNLASTKQSASQLLRKTPKEKIEIEDSKTGAKKKNEISPTKSLTSVFEPDEMFFDDQEENISSSSSSSEPNSECSEASLRPRMPPNVSGDQQKMIAWLRAGIFKRIAACDLTLRDSDENETSESKTIHINNTADSSSTNFGLSLPKKSPEKPSNEDIGNSSKDLVSNKMEKDKCNKDEVTPGSSNEKSKYLKNLKSSNSSESEDSEDRSSSEDDFVVITSCEKRKLTSIALALRAVVDYPNESIEENKQSRREDLEKALRDVCKIDDVEMDQLMDGISRKYKETAVYSDVDYVRSMDKELFDLGLCVREKRLENLCYRFINYYRYHRKVGDCDVWFKSMFTIDKSDAEAEIDKVRAGILEQDDKKVTEKMEHDENVQKSDDKVVENPICEKEASSENTIDKTDHTLVTDITKSQVTNDVSSTTNEINIQNKIVPEIQNDSSIVVNDVSMDVSSEISINEYSEPVQMQEDDLLNCSTDKGTPVLYTVSKLIPGNSPMLVQTPDKSEEKQTPNKLLVQQKLEQVSSVKKDLFSIPTSKDIVTSIDNIKDIVTFKDKDIITSKDKDRVTSKNKDIITSKEEKPSEILDKGKSNIENAMNKIFYVVRNETKKHVEGNESPDLKNNDKKSDTIKSKLIKNNVETSSKKDTVISKTEVAKRIDTKSVVENTIVKNETKISENSETKIVADVKKQDDKLEVQNCNSKASGSDIKKTQPSIRKDFFSEYESGKSSNVKNDTKKDELVNDVTKIVTTKPEADGRITENIKETAKNSEGEINKNKSGNDEKVVDDISKTTEAVQTAKKSTVTTKTKTVSDFDTMLILSNNKMVKIANNMNAKPIRNSVRKNKTATRNVDGPSAKNEKINNNFKVNHTKAEKVDKVEKLDQKLSQKNSSENSNNDVITNEKKVENVSKSKEIDNVKTSKDHVDKNKETVSTNVISHKSEMRNDVENNKKVIAQNSIMESDDHKADIPRINHTQTEINDIILGKFETVNDAGGKKENIRIVRNRQIDGAGKIKNRKSSIANADVNSDGNIKTKPSTAVKNEENTIENAISPNRNANLKEHMNVRFKSMITVAKSNNVSKEISKSRPEQKLENNRRIVANHTSNNTHAKVSMNNKNTSAQSGELGVTVKTPGQLKYIPSYCGNDYAKSDIDHRPWRGDVTSMINESNCKRNSLKNIGYKIPKKTIPHQDTSNADGLQKELLTNDKKEQTISKVTEKSTSSDQKIPVENSVDHKITNGSRNVAKTMLKNVFYDKKFSKISKAKLPKMSRLKELSVITPKLSPEFINKMLKRKQGATSPAKRKRSNTTEKKPRKKNAGVRKQSPKKKSTPVNNEMRVKSKVSPKRNGTRTKRRLGMSAVVSSAPKKRKIIYEHVVGTLSNTEQPSNDTNDVEEQLNEPIKMNSEPEVIAKPATELMYPSDDSLDSEYFKVKFSPNVPHERDFREDSSPEALIVEIEDVPTISKNHDIINMFS